MTSANLTGHALDQNLEVGVLIRGGQAPRRLMEHFHALIARGTLARLWVDSDCWAASGSREWTLETRALESVLCGVSEP